MENDIIYYAGGRGCGKGLKVAREMYDAIMSGKKIKIIRKDDVKSYGLKADKVIIDETNKILQHTAREICSKGNRWKKNTK